MYPCYLDYGGSVKVDDECLRRHLIDEKFKDVVRKLVADLVPRKKNWTDALVSQWSLLFERGLGILGLSPTLLT